MMLHPPQAMEPPANPARFTTDVGDAPVLPELIGQIPPDQEIASVTVDGAFDPRKCHDAIDARSAREHKRTGPPEDPATPSPVATRQCPEVAGLGFAHPRVQHRGTGLIHEQAAGSFEVNQHPVDDRCQMIGRRAAPACQGRAVQIDAATFVDLALAVKRQMAGIFGDGHMGRGAFGGQAR